MGEAVANQLTVKDAVRLAKTFVNETFADEGIINLGLEEIKFDENTDEFQITLGFSRDWDKHASVLPANALLFAGKPPTKLHRTYKKVFVRKDGSIERVENRETAESS